MTLKEILLQELETADDTFIAAVIDWVRSHKQQATISLLEIKGTADEYNRAVALVNLAVVDAEYLPEALVSACKIQEQFPRACLLIALAKIEPDLFSEALEAAQMVQGEQQRETIAQLLTELFAKQDATVLPDFSSQDDLVSDAEWLNQLRQKIAIGTEQIRNGQVTYGEEVFNRIRAKLPDLKQPEV